MKDYPQLLIVKLDTGFLIITENERHSIASNDKLIAKVRGRLDIPTASKKKNMLPELKTEQVVEPQPKTIESLTPHLPPGTTKLKEALDLKTHNVKFGILSSFTENGKWPIKKSDYLVPELISIPNNEKVRYAETSDSRIFIEYKTGRIYTTWEEITDMLSKIKPGSELLHVPVGFSSNQRTCIRQFMLAIRDGLKAGDSVELDPDKEFRKQLNTKIMHSSEAGTLETIE